MELDDESDGAPKPPNAGVANALGVPTLGVLLVARLNVTCLDADVLMVGVALPKPEPKPPKLLVVVPAAAGAPTDGVLPPSENADVVPLVPAAVVRDGVEPKPNALGAAAGAAAAAWGATMVGATLVRKRMVSNATATAFLSHVSRQKSARK